MLWLLHKHQLIQSSLCWHHFSHTLFISVIFSVKGHLKMAIDEWVILSAVEVRSFKEFGWQEWLRTWNNWLSICLVASVLSAVLSSRALSSGLWMHRCNQIELVLRVPFKHGMFGIYCLLFVFVQGSSSSVQEKLANSLALFKMATWWQR